MDDQFKRHIDNLVILLEDWADWQRGYSGARGYSNHSPGLQSGYASSTFEDLCQGVDRSVCMAVDSTVDDLPSGHRAAIHRRYGISAVFRFPRGNYEMLLCEAHELLLAALPKKGVVV